MFIPMFDHEGELSELKKSHDDRPTVIGSLNTFTDDSCESGYRYYTVAHPNMKADDIRAWAADYFPGEHCQHSYDCCGRTYSGRGYLETHSADIAVIRVSWHVNI